jgi:predicted metal-dependent phosphoesterase TrpH
MWHTNADPEKVGVYFGNLHSHTSYSDGSGTPSEAYKYARDTAKLDFLAITEHNHISAESGAKADRKDGILIAKTHSLYEGHNQTPLFRARRSSTRTGNSLRSTARSQELWMRFSRKRDCWACNGI